MTVPPAVATRLRRVVLGVALTVLLLDQLTKTAAVLWLEGRSPVVLVPAWFGEGVGPLLQLTFVRNPGAAFSLGTGMTWVFGLLAIGMSVVIWRVSRQLGSLLWAVALGGMLGGALGNLTDRLLRAPGVLTGHVVDFLRLPSWPVFNVADMAIVGSAVILVLAALLGRDIDGSRVR